MFSISVLGVLVAVLTMCTFYLFVENYNNLIGESGVMQRLLGSEPQPKHWGIPTLSVMYRSVTPRLRINPRVLAYYLLIGGSVYLITAIAVSCYAPTLNIKSLLKALYKKLISIVTAQKDIKLELESVCGDLCAVLRSKELRVASLPDDPEAQVETFRKLVVDSVRELRIQHEQQIKALEMDLETARMKHSNQENAQKMYESEVQKDFKFMLAVKDSTIFALRISVKEHEQEIEQLKNTLRQQYRAFHQSSELVTALKDGLLLEHKLKDQLAVELSAAISAPSFATSIRCLEKYYSHYDKRRENTIHWSDPQELHNVYMAKGELGDRLPPIPKLGLLAVPWSQDESMHSSSNLMEFDRVSTA